jgi:pimeloyl-ACP methyl ester carboxylesterase
LAQWYLGALTGAGCPLEARALETSHGATHVLATGPASGPAVVLVPGAGTNAPALWLPTMRALSRTHRVWALDLPGHPGRSAPRAIPTRGPGYGQWLAGVLDGLGLRRAAFVGASLGCYAVLQLAARDPGRIAGAVLSAPAGLVPVSRWGLLRMAPGIVAGQLLGSREQVRRTLQFLAGGGTPVSESMVDLMEIALEPGRLAGDQFSPPALTARELSAFRAPTLVIAGARDPLFPALALSRAAREILPHAELRVLERMAHLPGPAEVEAMNAMLLDRLSGGFAPLGDRSEGEPARLSG